MTDLDRRVAALRGWVLNNIYDPVIGVEQWWFNSANHPVAIASAYSPSTNLLQAFALWDEARPEGCQITVYQCKRTGRFQVWWSDDDIHDMKVESITDLPRAVTEAWCEAREAR